MCVTFFCLQPKNTCKQGVQFLIGFNRDEQTQRSTDPLGPFSDDPNIYAGRDKISGGTWLGVNVKTGIMVILTNYDLLIQRSGKSRGKLVLSFLKTSSYEGLSVEEYNENIKQRLCAVLGERQNYSAFNLLVYSIQTSKMFYICSEMALNEPRILQKNLPYGMCNGPLDEMWEKTKHGLGKFQKVLNQIDQTQNTEDYFFRETLSLLKDKVRFDQDLQKEASVFVNPYYCHGQKAQRMTKCSFVCLVERREGGLGFEISMKEVTYSSPQLQQSCVEYNCEIGSGKMKQ